MAKQTVNTGSSANSRDGDSLRAAFTKINANFTELYDRAVNTDAQTLSLAGNTLSISGGNSVELNITPLGDLKGSVFADDSTLLVDGVNASIPYAVLSGAPTIPADVSDLTDTTNLLSGSIDLSAVAQNIVPSVDSDGTTGYTLGSPTFKWKELFVSNGSIYIGDIKLSNANGKLLAKKVRNPGQENEEEDPDDSDATSEIAVGPVQPYLELTDTPIVIQPAVLGTPVTVTVPPSGINAELIVEIGEGPVINAIVVVSPGTDYVVGQRYRIWNYQIGGGGDSNSIDFEVATVGQAGELLTITSAAFTGPTPNNPQQTYTNISPDYQPQPVLDEIDVGLTLTRDQNQGIYNIELEQDYDRENYLSPLGTEWNSDGWGNLLGLEARTYTTWRQALNNQVGNNIVASELVMHDIANDKYYKFDFTNWGGSNGNYSYTRTLIGEDRNYFRKDDYATANNVDVIEDDSTLQIGITRGNNNGIYNPFTEEDWDQNVSPQGTLWNIDGWDDLSDVETRTYTNFYAAYGSGQLGNRVPGSKAVMYVPSIEKYYAIEWLGWTQNNVGGGFSYNRYEIDLTKLNEGITFADGTVQKTAYVDTNVVSTAQGERRIETASGYKQVAVTERVTTDYTGAVSQTTNGYELRIARTPELDAVLLPLRESDLDATYTLSFDNTTYREIWFSSVQETEYWFYYENDFGQTTPQTEGDPVYLRIITGGDSQIWWNKSELPGGASDFRGAVIDYHAYTGEATIIGTIHIVDDDGENYITHTEVSSGDNDSMNDNLWIVTSEGTIRYARFDGEAKTLKIHWTGKVFYGSEYNDD